MKNPKPISIILGNEIKKTNLSFGKFKYMIKINRLKGRMLFGLCQSFYLKNSNLSSLSNTENMNINTININSNSNMNSFNTKLLIDNGLFCIDTDFMTINCNNISENRIIPEKLLDKLPIGKRMYEDYILFFEYDPNLKLIYISIYDDNKNRMDSICLSNIEGTKKESSLINDSYGLTPIFLITQPEDKITVTRL